MPGLFPRIRLKEERDEHDPFSEEEDDLSPSEGYSHGGGGDCRLLKLVGVFGHEPPLVSMSDLRLPETGGRAELPSPSHWKERLRDGHDGQRLE